MPHKMPTTNGDGHGLYRAADDPGPIGGLLHPCGHYYKGDLTHHSDGSREFRPYPEGDPRQPWNREQ